MNEFTLAENANMFTDAAAQLVAWAESFGDVDAHLVYSYIQEGSSDHGNLRMVPGAFEGVTIQWSIFWDPTSAGTRDQPGDPSRVAAFAVHVRPGQTVIRTSDGFEVAQ